MTVSVVLQFRVPAATGSRLDKLAREQGCQRAEVARQLIEAALITSATTPASQPATDFAALDEIADRFGELIARVEAGRESSVEANRAASAAYAAIRLGMLMLLPSERQAAFVDKLAEATKK